MSNPAAVTAARRSRGICTRCGFFEAVPDHASCVDCLVRQRAKQRASRRAAVMQVELQCSSCGCKQSEPAHEDDLMSTVVARASCLFCGTKTMRRWRGS